MKHAEYETEVMRYTIKLILHYALYYRDNLHLYYIAYRRAKQMVLLLPGAITLYFTVTALSLGVTVTVKDG